MFNDRLNKWYVTLENSHTEFDKTMNILAMSGCGIEPREFKYQEL